MRLACCLLLLAASAPAALADGGTVLLHRDAGPFTVTLFAAGLPLEVGPADLSVMVQSRATGEVLLDPDVQMVLTGEDASSITVKLTQGTVGNRLLQVAAVDFPHAGKWTATLRIARGSEQAEFSTQLTIEPNRSRGRLVLFYVLLPLAIILLFAVHQTLKQRQSRSIRG